MPKLKPQVEGTNRRREGMRVTNFGSWKQMVAEMGKKWNPKRAVGKGRRPPALQQRITKFLGNGDTRDLWEWRRGGRTIQSIG